MSMAIGFGVGLTYSSVLNSVLSAFFNGLTSFPGYPDGVLVGDHANITATLPGGVAITSQKWGSTRGGSELGTGASPTDFTALDNGDPTAPATLYYEAVGADGETYFARKLIRRLPTGFTTLPTLTLDGTDLVLNPGATNDESVQIVSTTLDGLAVAAPNGRWPISPGRFEAVFRTVASGGYSANVTLTEDFISITSPAAISGDLVPGAVLTLTNPQTNYGTPATTALTFNGLDVSGSISGGTWTVPANEVGELIWSWEVTTNLDVISGSVTAQIVADGWLITGDTIVSTIAIPATPTVLNDTITG